MEDFFIGGRTGEFFPSGMPQPEEEEEPEMPELPMDRPSVGGLSDEDYNAWMDYSKFKERLARTKSALTQAKKMGKSRDDLSLGSSEVERLTKLKASLEQRVQSIIDSNEYVRNKVEQEKNAPSEDEIMERFQKLANIIK